MAPTQGERLPEQFGRYRIIQRLGQGGMGSVFLAEDTQLGRRVALKVSDLRNSPEGLKRFEREARALAALDHPYICHVYDFGNHDGIPFLVMAHIAGASLAESLPEAGLPPRQAAALVGKLALAMQEAHARDILHRDLKPSNVMMKPTSTGPVPIIVDFGLARGSGSAVEALTGTGQAIGTLPYMPLEQINGDKTIGPACDIYALGVILYELLTGEKPFDGPFSSIIAQKLSAKPPSPSALRPGLDPRLDAICLKAMAKEAKDRYASMSELAAALTAFLKKPDSQVRPAGEHREPERTAAVKPGSESTREAVPLIPKHKSPEKPIPQPRPPAQPKPPAPQPAPRDSQHQPIRPNPRNERTDEPIIRPTGAERERNSLEARAKRLLMDKGISWPYFVCTVYGACVVACLLCVLYSTGEWVTDVLILLILNASMLAASIGSHWKSPWRQVSTLITLLGSATCAFFLLLGSFIALLWTVTRGPSAYAEGVSMGAGVVWLVWIVVFGYRSRSINPISRDDLMYKLLFFGSVLELMFAVWAFATAEYSGHRTDWSDGIGIGLAVMSAVLGKAVYSLFVQKERS